MIFTFVNLSNELRLFHEGLTPVARSRTQPNWLRLHEGQVFYYQSQNHGGRYVLSLAFRFLSYDDEHQFALFYPYVYTDLTSFISRWSVQLKRLSNKQQSSNTTVVDRLTRRSPELLIRRNLNTYDDHIKRGAEPRTRSSLGFTRKLNSRAIDSSLLGKDVNFDVRVLGTSIMCKPIFLLSIKGLEWSSNVDTTSFEVVIMARLTGNVEGAASLVCQGIIDYMLSDGIVARIARHHINFHILPMIDPDSVCAGNSRTDLMGQSKVTLKMLKANKSIYHNLSSIHHYLQEVCSRKKRVIIIELGVNLGLIGSRMIGVSYEDSLRMERHLSLPKLLSRFANDFYLENCEFLKIPQASGGLPFCYTRLVR